MSIVKMEYSKSGLALTESFEGCKLVAYLDQVGVPTIGYGHTSGVFLGQTCTQNEAEAWLAQDCQSATDAVNRLVKVPLSQNQFDSLVDFVYNLGAGSLQHSTLLRLLNQGDLEGAANEFKRWDRAGGVEVAGLLRRRKAEEDLFNSK